jgi:cytochrome c oxidase assembly protein subunit 15
MIHRYLATGVGALLLAMLFIAWRERRVHAAAAPGAPPPADGGGRLSLAWTSVAVVLVVAQGAFGALTVTMKLYPAIVVAHLLGGLGLLALLAMQFERLQTRHLGMTVPLRRMAGLVSLLVLLQVALGGWVSTNYAVLACTDFPTCHGVWWPDMDFEHGFAIARPLGVGRDGGVLPFEALTAIHVTHRLMAVPVIAGLLILAWRLVVLGGLLRRFGLGLVVLTLWQAASGIGNVVLGWPLAAALAHTGGAAALVLVLARLMSALPVESVAHLTAAPDAAVPASSTPPVDTRHPARWHHV